MILTPPTSTDCPGSDNKLYDGPCGHGNRPKLEGQMDCIWTPLIHNACKQHCIRCRWLITRLMARKWNPRAQYSLRARTLCDVFVNVKWYFWLITARLCANAFRLHKSENLLVITDYWTTSRYKLMWRLDEMRRPVTPVQCHLCDGWLCAETLRQWQTLYTGWAKLSDTTLHFCL